MLEGRQCVKHKWVFDIKQNGVFQAKLVACGYSQLPGVNFTEVYSPVVSNVTLRLLVILVLIQNYYTKIIDVETAFLHGMFDKEHEVFMDCPDGMDAEPDECLLLLKQYMISCSR